jgi:hypothetical protein
MTERNVLDPRSLARIAGIASAITAIIAAAVALTIAGQVRRWLGFGFAGVPPRIGEAGSILLDNGRFVLGLGAAALLAQLIVRGTRAKKPTDAIRMLAPLSIAVDAVVLLAVLVNVALVGVAVGAYGGRMLVALLPHGPFEVCAYCIAANLFINARRRPIARREWLTAGLVCAGMLTLAAVLETFTWLG